MSPSTAGDRRLVHALKVHQWLPEWDDIQFDIRAHRQRPPATFYLLAMPASELRALSGIFRRSAQSGTARSLDLGIQRRHDSDRSAEIHQFVTHGFPWSALSGRSRASGKYDDLKKPGWLPTAIVFNILKRDDTRNGHSVQSADVLEVMEEKGDLASLLLPSGFDERTWQPSAVAPIEVIDGQHRLWAFEDRDFAPGFSLPVVAFHGLDISWQAYLFYTINIKPKRINTSLAFDLYPLLRTEDWLERFEGHPIYRETRAQEVTEALWSYPESPWHDRIDMLGSMGGRYVTQAAWIRSLLATFVKSFDSPRTPVGGLFGAPMGADRPVLGWSRAQQSALIIYIWQAFEVAVGASKAEWARELRSLSVEQPSDVGLPNDVDPAFSSRYSLIDTDQGVRGVLALFNDILYVRADWLRIEDIESDEVGEGTSEMAISDALSAFRDAPRLSTFIEETSMRLAEYDWRLYSTPGLTSSERQAKARFRGGTGYRELRSDLLTHVATGVANESADAATEVADSLGLGF